MTCRCKGVPAFAGPQNVTARHPSTKPALVVTSFVSSEQSKNGKAGQQPAPSSLPLCTACRRRTAARLLATTTRLVARQVLVASGPAAALGDKAATPAAGREEAPGRARGSQELDVSPLAAHAPAGHRGAQCPVHRVAGAAERTFASGPAQAAGSEPADAAQHPPSPSTAHRMRGTSQAATTAGPSARMFMSLAAGGRGG